MDRKVKGKGTVLITMITFMVMTTILFSLGEVNGTAVPLSRNSNPKNPKLDLRNLIEKYLSSSKDSSSSSLPLRSSFNKAIRRPPPDGTPQNVTEIIRGYGYPCQDFSVTTPDGYILSLQYIANGRNNATKPYKRPVVFLQHGISDSSVGWTLNPPRESLAFILADLGFSVWLGNTRGNLNTLKNIHFNASDPKFWNFTFDEMAQYDFPTMLNFAIKQSDAKTIGYVCHGEGCTQAIAGLLLQPNLARFINSFITLAPIAYMGNINSLFLLTLAELRTPELFQLLGYSEFYEPNAQAFIDFFSVICQWVPFICSDIVGSIFGHSTNYNLSRISYYFHYEPNPTSVKNIAHLAQLIRSGEFRMYDYGTAGNMIKYNSTLPPIYDITKFPSSIPVGVFHGSNDAVADPTDVKKLISLLPSTFPYPTFVHLQPGYAHLDPILDDEAYLTIYPLVTGLLKTHAEV